MAITVLLAILISSVLFVKLLMYWWSNRRYYELASKLPKIGGELPLIGQGHRLLGVDSKGLYDLLYEVTMKPGPSLRSTWLGEMLIVIADDPNHVQHILSSKDYIDRPSLYKGLCCPVSLMGLNGNAWKERRKLLDPSFNAATLKSFFAIFNKNAKRSMNDFQNLVGKGEVNVIELFSVLALDNILTTSTGINRESQREVNDKFMTDVSQVLHVLATKFFNIWMQWDFLYKFTKTYQLEQRHLINGIDKLSKHVIDNAAVKSIDETTDESKIFINQLLKIRNFLSQDAMIDEIGLIVVTGFETVALTLSSAVLLMGMNPEIQEKVFKELSAVLPSKDENLSEAKLNQLEYLDLTVKEVLRFLPPAPYIARCLPTETKIGDYMLPVGATVAFPIRKIHRDKSIWGEDAHEFKPERFLPENFAKIHPYGYLPFSRGPRNCIGYSYGLKSVKIALACFMRRFKVTTSLEFDELQFDYNVTSKALQGYKVSLEDREF